jgi:Pyruvate/2-oxoacid:ferredoxin oxidoreductase delta subunit
MLQLALCQEAAGQPLAPADRCALLSALLDNGYSVTVAVERQPSFADGLPCLVLGVSLPKSRPDLTAPPDPPPARFQDISGWPIARVVALVEATRAELNAPKPGNWQPWFPVIDYDRCTNCLQCLSFCLFGVFGVDAQHRIRVEHSANCKTNCPACARVCPEAAIIFPKYKAGPINGDEASAVALPREKMKIDISALLGGDIYSLLRERSERAKARFSKQRAPDTALQERLRCLRESSKPAQAQARKPAGRRFR